MRTWGRDQTGAWHEITDTSRVWLATLVQTLRLEQNESPLFGNYGLPARQSVNTQIAPDAAVARTQSQYAPHFASLVVSADTTAQQPTYSIVATEPDGSPINTDVYT